MAASAVFPSMQTVQIDGLVQYSARAHFYEPGTTTPKTVYTTAALDVAHPNPLPVNGVGRFPPIFLGPGNYRVQIKVDAGTVVEDYDDLPGGPEDPPVIPPTPSAGTVIPTGFEMTAEVDTPRAGWVRANGRTIGNASSDATELASADCYELFKQRWNKLPALSVTGGRGISAEADWLAGKAIPLPDARGRANVGRDAMGASTAGRLTTATCANPDEAGFGFGAQQVQLTGTQNGPHTHTASTNSTGQHDHSGSTTDTQGAHSHNHDDSTATAPANVLTDPGGALITYGSSLVTRATAGGGEHAHSVNVVNDGQHSHTVTVNSAGNGDAHNNVQPSRLVTVFIKL